MTNMDWLGFEVFGYNFNNVRCILDQCIEKKTKILVNSKHQHNQKQSNRHYQNTISATVSTITL